LNKTAAALVVDIEQESVQMGQFLLTMAQGVVAGQVVRCDFDL
jgi:hypothetical protein